MGLDFHRCPGIQKDVVSFLKENFAHLTHLSLSSCNPYPEYNSLLTELVESFPKLECLDISWSQTEDDTLIAIADHCPNLKVLNLRSNSNVFEAQYITDRSLLHLFGKCGSLTKLIFPAVLGNIEITDQSLIAIADNCKMLTYLHCHLSFFISQEVLANLKEKLPDLIISDNVHDVAFFSIFPKTNDCEVLEVSSLESISFDEDDDFFL
jgi:hypothetical protein